MPKNLPKPSPMKRRTFLQLAGLSGLAASLPAVTGCTHKKFFNPDNDILIGGGRFKQNDELHHVLAIFNLQQRETERVELEFLPHGTIIDPRNKQHLFCFEKNGINAAEIDLASLSERNHFSADDNTIFAGHGAFDPSGDYFYSVETDLGSRQGHISIRDRSGFSIIEQMPSFGQNPHQCQLSDDGKILMIANSGSDDSAASLCYIDVQKITVLEKIILDDPSIDISHFSRRQNGELVIASAPRQSDQAGRVSIGSVKDIMTMTEPGILVEKLLGPALTICIDENHDVAAVCHPQANLVTFWALDKRTLIKAISVPNPRGIALSIDERNYIVSFEVNTSAVLIDTKTLAADTQSIMQPTYASGEHIINWSKTLRKIMPTQVYS